jgi:hypothetical protein
VSDDALTTGHVRIITHDDMRFNGTKEVQAEGRSPPTPCVVCERPDCDDWMYRTGMVPAEQAICEACKVELGRKIKVHEDRDMKFEPFIPAKLSGTLD